MKIQSLSVVVPNPACRNNCRFCVSKMNKDSNVKNQIDDFLPFFDLYLKDYLKRLQFAKDNGCNTVMLTGNSEPQQNRKFLTYFGLFMQMMDNPFRWVEMQTTGMGLDRNYLRFLRNHVGVNLISLSISSFVDEINWDIMRTPINHKTFIKSLAKDIKEYDFNLRLSLNLTNEFDSLTPDEIFTKCKRLNADQVTFRVLYSSNSKTDEDKWVKENKASKKTIKNIKKFIKKEGKLIGTLPYGAKKYSVYGMSVVMDEDCMAKKNFEEENYKYLVLKPDCKLYSQWDDPASLIF